MSPTAGEDYGTEGDSNPPVYTSLTIAPDESFIDIEVPIIDDECDENNEPFGADLSVTPPDHRVTLDRTVVTIVDNDDKIVMDLHQIW